MESPLQPDAGSRFQKIDKVVLLAQCPLFSRLSQWELRSISQMMRLVEYKKDEIVYQEGGEGERFYVIVSGRFEAYVTSAGKKRVLAYLRRGDYFGEMSLLTDQPHSATIHALSDSLVLEIKKDGFKKFIEHNATISLELSRRLSSRLKVTDPQSRALFKSDVLSIYGGLSRSQREQFSINLAACVMAETHQRTVLLDLESSESDTGAEGQAKRIPLKDLQNAESWTSEDLRKVLTRHRAGFDCLFASYDPGDAAALDVMASILNHLAIDYRFILVDLSADLDELDLRAVSQSDALFVVTDSHLNSLTEAKEAIRQIERTLSFPEEKISVVVQEVVFGAHTTAALRTEMFGKKRYFSLPLPPAAQGAVEEDQPLVTEMPDSEYSRTVRYMSRYLSGNLVGIALGSGAALGLAHIGVLKVLEREKIPIDIVAGSSIGALIGSLYAVGLSAAEIEKAATQINLRVLFGRLIDISLFPVRGLMHGRQVMRHFRKHLGSKTFDQCRIPLKITGANLTTRQGLVFDTGSVSEAVRTSIAIPALIKPVIRGLDVIVDGGILNPLPIHALQQSGANKIIAVNVFPTTKDMLERRLMREEIEDKEKSEAREKGFFSQGLYWWSRSVRGIFSPNLFDILMNTIQAMEAEIAEVEGESADVLVRPVLPAASWVEFFRPEKFIRRGEEEALKMLPKIKALVSQQNV